jgi:thiamine biosynthesis lipoprotein
MGSDVHVIVVGGAADLLDRAQQRIDELERRWSRFIETSEVSELNRRAGTFVAVSDDTVLLVRRAVEAWRLTGGSFDPTVLGAVIRAGYDRSFEEVAAAPALGTSVLGLGVTDIEIDGRQVRVAAGTGFDPGGIGKGLSADLVCAELRQAGADGVCVNVGGDIRVSGVGPDGASWTVAVEHPWVREPLVLLGLEEGAVATSTILKRQWEAGGRTRHHLIDPQTGEPSTTDATLATVVAAHAWVAETLAKAVLLAGMEHPFDILGGTEVQALVVGANGTVVATDGLAAYLGGAPLVSSLPAPRS